MIGITTQFDIANLRFWFPEGKLLKQEMLKRQLSMQYCKKCRSVIQALKTEQVKTLLLRVAASYDRITSHPHPRPLQSSAQLLISSQLTTFCCRIKIIQSHAHTPLSTSTNDPSFHDA